MTIITDDIHLVALALKKGDVVALPTETVYGLAASIYQEEALKNIYTLKGRPGDNPLIIHALNLAMVEQIAYINDDFLKVYKAFMPGPLTVLLDKKEVSDSVTCGLDTVAIRVPSHPLFQRVLEELNEPLAAPSANLSGKPSSTQASHVYEDFSPHLGLILDGGPCLGGIESTIIRIYPDYGVILRPGLVSKESLEAVVQKPFIYAKANAALQAPGMKYKHYAPKAKVILIDDEALVPLDQPHTMVMAQEKFDCPIWQKLSEENLYKAFRLADELKLHCIYVLIGDHLSEGLSNRLEKAAH